MNNFSIINNTISFCFTLLLLGGCGQMSETKQNPAMGFNGGFEIIEDGLPVNWIFYTKKTVGSGDFIIETDNTMYKEGTQSLYFDVTSCSAKGGRFSPGCATETDVIPGETYTLSFWVKNSGATFSVSAGAIQPTTGLVRQLTKSNEIYNEWKRFEYAIDIPKDYHKMRFELSILSPGKLMIDDVKIEKADK